MTSIASKQQPAHLLYITSADVYTLIDYSDLKHWLTEKIRSKNRDLILAPNRQFIELSNPYRVQSAVAASSHELGYLITKIASLRVSECKDEFSGVRSVLVVCCSNTGKLIAILDGGAITNVRCTVLTSIITENCASQRVDKFGLIGAGTQAFNQIIGVTNATDVNEICIYARSDKSIERLINKIEFYAPLILSKITIARSIESSIQDAQVISTATTSQKVLFDEVNGGKLEHINCVGWHSTTSREVSNPIISSSKVIVEDTKAAVREAGDTHSDSISVEELLSLEGKMHASRVPTIFCSVGHITYDYLVALYVLKKLPELKHLRG